MKKINKKLLIGLSVFIFSIFTIFIVKADDPTGFQFFRVNSASTTPANAKRAGDEAGIYVVNRSGKDYFVPNKTLSEFNSFRNNAPNYVSVSVCGDGVCKGQATSQSLDELSEFSDWEVACPVFIFQQTKPSPEFESFRKNAPNYVSVSVSGDEICSEGETLDNCKEDCKSPQAKYVDYCGDGICNQKVYI